jgi:hypothetical protein
MNATRKAIAILLSVIVLFFTTISLLATWDIIEYQKVFQKSMMSLIIIFASAAIILFIFSVIYKSDSER